MRESRTIQAKCNFWYLNFSIICQRILRSLLPNQHYSHTWKRMYLFTCMHLIELSLSCHGKKKLATTWERITRRHSKKEHVKGVLPLSPPHHKYIAQHTETCIKIVIFFITSIKLHGDI